MKADWVDWEITTRTADAAAWPALLPRVPFSLWHSPEWPCFAFFPFIIILIEVHQAGRVGCNKAISHDAKVRNTEKTLLVFCMPPSEVFYSHFSTQVYMSRLNSGTLGSHRATHTLTAPLECVRNYREQRWTSGCKGITSSFLIWGLGGVTTDVYY